MKIAYVIDDTLDSNDGVQQYVILLAGWMKKQGHEVHYITGETKKRKLKNIHSLAENIHVRFNKNRLSVPYRVDKQRLNQLCKDHHWDVVHVQMPFSPFLAGRVITKLYKRSAIVATFHIAPHGKYVKYASKALALISQRTVGKISRFISVSSVAKRFAKDTYNIESDLIPNSIDLKKWAPVGPVKKSTTITFVGRLVERKGCHLLLEAISSVVKGKYFQDIKVNILGDGPDRYRLEKYVKDNKLSSIVTFLGHVSETQKKELLQSSQLTVLPATGGESFGIVLLEAMAAGSVVIGGNNPGYRTVLKTVPESLVKLDPSMIAKKISRLLSDQQNVQALYIKQQVLIAKYDIEVVGSDILELYKESVTKVNISSNNEK